MSGGKTKETVNQTSTVQLPAWMSQAGQQLWTDASAAATANPIQGYTGRLTAGTNANQNQASTAAQGQGDRGQRDLGAARYLTGAAASGNVDRANGGVFDNAAAQQYANPYLQQVQQRTLSEMGRQNQMQMDTLGDNMAAGRAYGGTRQAVMEAELARGQQSNILDYLAQSNAASYDQARSAFEADRQARMNADNTNINSQQAILDRLLNAGGQAASIGQTDQAMGSNAILDLLRTGGVQQDSENAALQAAYNEFLRMQDAPMSRYQDLAGILSGTPRNTTTTNAGTSTTQQNGGWLNAILGGGQIAAAALSERFLKTDIMRVGTRDGLPIYSWRYQWEPKGAAHIGPMADDVARIAPERLGPTMFGARTIDTALMGAA